MTTKIITAIVSGIIVASLCATAKCVVDVARQEERIEAQKILLLEVRDDVKIIKKRIMK